MKLTVYSKPNCPSCELTKKLFEQFKIDNAELDFDFEVKDVAANPEYREELFKAFSDMNLDAPKSVPQVIWYKDDGPYHVNHDGNALRFGKILRDLF